jgi:hypothetical protein
MSEYQKRCFDMIIPTVEENKALKEDIVHLQEHYSWSGVSGTHCRPR